MALVLVVDDDPVSRLLLVNLLASAGYRVLQAADGAEALAVVRAEHPDLIIADVLMPTIDGYEFVRQLRGDKTVADTRVIFCTGHYHEPSARTLARAFGVSMILAKPWEADVLLRTVETALQNPTPPSSLPTGPEFDHDHLRLLTDTLSRKVGELETEVAERKRTEDALRQSERLFRDMAEMVPDIIFTARPDGSVDYINSRLYEITGLEPGSGLGNGWTDALKEDDFERVRGEWINAFSAGKPFESRFCMKTTGDVSRWFVARARPVRDDAGKIVRWIGSATDIHDMWVAEQALQDANRKKDEFLSVLAHELRNPLAPIQTSVELLRYPGVGPAQRDRALELISGQVRNLSRLLDDLLDVSRITQGRIELRKERIELADVVSRALDISRPLIERWQHNLTVDLPPGPVWLNADATRIAQVLSNLLNNAAKYTDPGGFIRLSAAVSGTELEVSVEDNGIGILPEMLPHAFDLFSQVDRSLDRTQNGLGIGLTIVRKMVELHGGTVEAFSAGQGEGSRFVVRLPVVIEEGPKTPESGHEEVSTHTGSRRILIVDDNKEFAEGWGMLLGVAGHKVKIAHDGLEALDVARTFHPQVVSLDIGLPGLDGYEVARGLRHQPGMDKALVVAISGYGDEESRRRAREAGCDVLLTKPVHGRDLLNLIAERVE